MEGAQCRHIDIVLAIACSATAVIASRSCSVYAAMVNLRAALCSATTETMAKTTPTLTKALETYFTELRQIRASGGATGERSYYPALANLLNAVGATLKPKVVCIGELADSGAGHPDFGLFAAKQLQTRRTRDGSHQQLPERGVVELKPLSDDVWLAAASDQISRYQERYRLVLVTNSCDFVLVGKDTSGRPTKLETLRLADSPEAFDRLLERPRAFAHEMGQSLGEYLRRALSHRTTLIEPKDLAWLLASYARDALARVEAAGDAPSLLAVRTALEQALGVRFQGGSGEALLPLDPGTDPLLRHLLRLGALVQANPTPHPPATHSPHRHLRLAYRRLAPASPGVTSTVPAAIRSRSAATARPGRTARLDRSRLGPGG